MRDLGKPSAKAVGETGRQLKAGEKADPLETVWILLKKKKATPVDIL
jgi:hypothetical protein